MNWPLQAAGLAGLAAACWLLARFPRALFSEAGETPHPRRAEYGLAAGMFVAAAGIFEAFPGGGPAARIALAILVVTLIGTVYSDMRYLVIPDLYNLVLAAGGVAINLAWPVAKGPHGLIEIALGAGLCGGLLAAVAWVWKRSTAIEGMGLGDVKLATGVGALLGMQGGVWAITASAAVGAVLGFILQARQKDAEAPMLFPYGASLALAGAGVMAWERWT